MSQNGAIIVPSILLRMTQIGSTLMRLNSPSPLITNLNATQLKRGLAQTLNILPVC